MKIFKTKGQVVALLANCIAAFYVLLTNQFVFGNFVSYPILLGILALVLGLCSHYQALIDRDYGEDTFLKWVGINSLFFALLAVLFSIGKNMFFPG